MFAARARVAHAAKAAGIVATCHPDGRRIELRCSGFEQPIWFSCLPKRVEVARDRRGRFASGTERDSEAGANDVNKNGIR